MGKFYHREQGRRHINFVNDVKHGESLDFDLNNQLKSRSIYDNGNLIFSESYHNNGNVMKRITNYEFRNVTHYSRTGLIIRSVKQDSKLITITNYYDNGNIKYIINNEFDSFNNSIFRSGATVKYFSNGTIALEQNYKYNKLEGVEKSYYPSGNLRFSTIYNNGIRQSVVEYYENSHIKEEIIYTKLSTNRTTIKHRKLYNENGTPIVDQNIQQIVSDDSEEGIPRSYLGIFLVVASFIILAAKLN